MMAQGVSWSGRERNNAFLNLRDGTFADASSILGLDFLDDGRGVASTDWDGDGDLDLWLRNRTGPQLRFMRNDAAQGNWIAFKLIGTRSNLDGVGTRVVVEAGGRRMIRTVTVGDGYLAQSSKRLHFGLGPITRIDRITVTWPNGGTDLIPPPQVGGFYQLREGTRQLEFIRPEDAGVAVADGGPGNVDPPTRTDIALRTPLPLPPSVAKALSGVADGGAAVVINLWSLTCPPCFEELADWASNKDALAGDTIKVLALNVDPESDRAAATEKFDELVGGAFENRFDPKLIDTLTTLVRHVRQLGDVDIVLPTSLMIDAKGNIDVVYLGATDAKDLIRDRRLFRRVKPHQRSKRGGRWFFSVPRDWKSLADLVPDANDAAFYRSMK